MLASTARHHPLGCRLFVLCVHCSSFDQSIYWFTCPYTSWLLTVLLKGFHATAAAVPPIDTAEERDPGGIALVRQQGLNDSSDVHWTLTQESGRGGKRRKVDSPTDDKLGGKGSTEGYRDRWVAKRPRPNPNSWLSGFCSACETDGEGLRESPFLFSKLPLPSSN